MDKSSVSFLETSKVLQFLIEKSNFRSQTSSNLNSYFLEVLFKLFHKLVGLFEKVIRLFKQFIRRCMALQQFNMLF